ncbi:MAG: mannose-6-phosphate isomerase [Clostridiales bacterium]|nr:class I mannose-6-phosphate isomerase [Eubacteriales bacterium]MDH7565723.1 mannose-6-phosphate isomerase [Clostridiales bacterium]
MLYPYKTVPIFKDYLWGGHNLKRLGKKAPDGVIAESWELCTLPGNESVIANGVEKGRNLKELIEKYGRLFLGHSAGKSMAGKKGVPFLLKYIDANDRLSIQVHPDDIYAFYHENGQAGKTEMWYILDAKPEACILHGFKEGCSAGEIKEAIHKGQHESIYRKIKVKKGDIVYIPAGTVHALNEGIVAAEIQQHSNLTYRIYDYDRVDGQGNRRPLHLERAFDVISYENKKPTFRGLEIDCGNYQVRYLTISKNFWVREWRMHGSEIKFMTEGNFHTFMILEGEACFAHGSERLHAGALETVVIPAGLREFYINGTFTALHTFIPDLTGNALGPLLQAGYSMDQIRSNVAGAADEEFIKQAV